MSLISRSKQALLSHNCPKSPNCAFFLERSRRIWKLSSPLFNKGKETGFEWWWWWWCSELLLLASYECVNTEKKIEMKWKFWIKIKYKYKFYFILLFIFPSLGSFFCKWTESKVCDVHNWSEISVRVIVTWYYSRGNCIPLVMLYLHIRCGVDMG